MEQICATLPWGNTTPSLLWQETDNSKLVKVPAHIRDSGFPEELALNHRINHDTRISNLNRRVDEPLTRWCYHNRTMSKLCQVIPTKFYLLLIHTPTPCRPNKPCHPIALEIHQGLLLPQLHNLEIKPISMPEAIQRGTSRIKYAAIANDMLYIISHV